MNGDPRTGTTWDDLDGLVAANGFAGMPFSAALDVIADVVESPVADGAPVGDGEFDADEATIGLLDEFADENAEFSFAAGLSSADRVARGAESVVSPALCRAAGVSPDVYLAAKTARDEGDDSLMLDMYSAFMDSITRGARHGRR